jgi:hypothetical protein
MRESQGINPIQPENRQSHHRYSFSFKRLWKIPDAPSRELHFPAKRLCRETAGKSEWDAIAKRFMTA